jgi:hypothetical protein
LLFHQICIATDERDSEAGELILKLVYDYTIEPHSNDPLVDLADHTMQEFTLATVPGAWLVDILPFLEHVPEWMPGAGFKKTARLWSQSLSEAVRIPYEYTKRQMAMGKQTASFVSKSIQQAKIDFNQEHLSAEQDHAIQWTALSLYLGGSDTTVETIAGFFLAMAKFPDVQQKAQEEIDRVVGTSRLPTFGDRENLPYINNIVYEAQRWHPIIPMGFPHVANEEDTISGYRIPKGALLLPAIWWFTRDPKVYHNAEQFKPERYSAPYNEPLPTDISFGFGRRVCPGRHLADAMLYLTFVQVLAIFNIQPAQKEDGQMCELTHSFAPGIISGVCPFRITITPRTVEHENLIEDVIQRFPWQESDKNYLGKIATKLNLTQAEGH